MTTRPNRFTRIRDIVRSLKRNITALYFAYLDPRTPWYAQTFILVVVAYALSPIDLIPDFVPVLGYLDDILLLPFGIWLALRLIPPPVMVDAHKQAALHPHIEGSLGRVAAVFIVAIYFLLALWLWFAFFRPPQ
jgi:uncharacterized membrane protein YkvA (DUF1232 family)